MSRRHGSTALKEVWHRAVRGGPPILPARREIIVRSGGRVLFIPLPGAVQLVLLGVLLVGAGWAARVVMFYADLQSRLDDRDSAIHRTLAENAELRGTMAHMRQEFSDVTGTLDRNHRAVDRMMAENGELRRSVSAMEAKLGQAISDRATHEKNEGQLRRQLAALEKKTAVAEHHSVELAGTLNSARSRLATASKAKKAVEAERKSLKGRVAALETRLASLRNSQRSLLGRISERTAQDIERVEHIIASVGLDADKLLSHAGRAAHGKTLHHRSHRKAGRKDEDKLADAAGKNGSDDGQGGPFVPFSDGDVKAGHKSGQVAARVKAYDRRVARWEDLRRLLRSLPLVAPLDHYRVASGFGRRRDPINGEMAIHEGIDLDAPRRTPIHATAPGTVVFAGVNGGYGRMVEIDHGFGVHTRYAHLQRIRVHRGEHVKFGQKIGLLGSSGRATGPHVHYEILIDDKPVNPARFMRAGKDVFKG